MKYVVLALITICLIGSVFAYLPVVDGAEAEDPLLTDPNVQWVDIKEGYGGRYTSITVTNKSGIERIVSLEWDYYSGPGEGEILTPREWFTRFPEPTLVPPGMVTVLNLTIEVPQGVAPLKYKSYIRVFDETGYARHTVIWVRLGEAVPEYEFSLTKAKFNLTLDKPGIGVATLGDLGIRNTGNVDATYQIIGRVPNLENDPGYTVAPYIDIDSEYIDYDWITIETPQISIESGQIGYPVVKVKVPEGILQGRYMIWIGVRCLDNTGNFINIGYSAKVLLDIDRTAPTKEKSLIGKYPLYILGGFVGILALAAVALLVSNWMKSRQDNKLPRYSQHRR